MSTPHSASYPQLPDNHHAIFPEIGNKSDYKARLEALQTQLTLIQQAYYHQQRPALIILEGWDAAGKGGAIRRLTEKMDARGVRVYPFGAPSEDEHRYHYLQRFVQRLPVRGQLVIFDRSYYGRVLVERVEQFASKDEWRRAYREINEMERMLSDDGIRIVKLFLHITPDEQLRRFSERLHNPAKRWKLTSEDIRNRARWDDYVRATNHMFRETHTDVAPWHIIPANHKWFARTEVLATVASCLSQGVDVSPPPLDEHVIRLAETELGLLLKDTTLSGKR
ncbi:polyphosphate kinase 2 family protein [Alteromonas sp. CYL-A6]|uniref:polyphosphate kinase 2 family protein n=1 Tax=Alteromonas nitratireducens TaxID=3390813 RepID=UPI0034BEFED0